MRFHQLFIGFVVGALLYNYLENQTVRLTAVIDAVMIALISATMLRVYYGYRRRHRRRIRRSSLPTSDAFQPGAITPAKSDRVSLDI